MVNGMLSGGVKPEEINTATLKVLLALENLMDALLVAPVSEPATFYGAIKSGQPPAQVINIFQAVEVQKEVRYEVTRPCKLQARPSFKSARFVSPRGQS